MQKLYTRDEAAAYLGFKRRTLDLWAHQKKGPEYIKIMGRIKYRKETLDEFLEKNTVKTS